MRDSIHPWIALAIYLMTSALFSIILGLYAGIIFATVGTTLFFILRFQERQAGEYLTEEPSMSKVVRCPECGRSNPSSNRYCGNCGYPLKVSETEDWGSITEDWVSLDKRRRTGTFRPTPKRGVTYLYLAILFSLLVLAYSLWVLYSSIASYQEGQLENFYFGIVASFIGMALAASSLAATRKRIVARRSMRQE